MEARAVTVSARREGGDAARRARLGRRGVLGRALLDVVRGEVEQHEVDVARERPRERARVARARARGRRGRSLLEVAVRLEQVVDRADGADPAVHDLEVARRQKLRREVAREPRRPRALAEVLRRVRVGSKEVVGRLKNLLTTKPFQAIVL